MSLTRLIFMYVLVSLILFGFASSQKLAKDEVDVLRAVAKGLHQNNWDFSVDPCDASTAGQDFTNAVTCSCSSSVCHVTSITLLMDRDGWHFTNNGRYTVKTGYQIERVYPDKERVLPQLGPSITPLKAFCWKIKCPPKMRHFLWQMLSGCLAVMKNLNARGIKGDTICTRCGNHEETINHVFFECPPAVQVWALSRIPSNPLHFPCDSLFANMDYLFWRAPPEIDDHHFAWILWYIWKARNCKVFSNLNIDPQDTLKVAETESRLWAEAQASIIQPAAPSPVLVAPQVPTNTGRWCFSDGSWKDKEKFSGQGWYSTLPGFEGLMGARNTRASLSPLHAEIEALIWSMECMRNLRQYNVTFATDCSQLVKMVSEPDEWPAFATYLEDIRSLRSSFNTTEIIHVPRTNNKKADSLARSARKQPSHVVHMDADPPVWLTESI